MAKPAKAAAKAGMAKAGKAKAGKAKAGKAGAGKGDPGKDGAAAKAGGGGNSLIWMQGLACGTLVALVPAMAVLLGVLLAPALVALALDQEPGRPVGRSALLCALAGAIGPVRALWAAGHGVDAALALLSGLGPIGIAWAAAAAGWLMAELIPLLARLGLEALAGTRLIALRATRTRHLAEWGGEEG